MSKQDISQVSKHSSALCESCESADLLLVQEWLRIGSLTNALHKIVQFLCAHTTMYIFVPRQCCVAPAEQQSQCFGPGSYLALMC